MARRAALVLAGGKAHRFQKSHQVWQDKALALLDDIPLLVQVVKNVITVVDEVIVCVDSEERKAKYLEILERQRLKVKIVIDEKSGVEGGPNVAILSGLKAVQTDFCIVIPCDMPFVKPDVANYLFNLSDNFDVVVPMWPSGILESLVMVLQHSMGREIVQTLCQLKRSRPSDIPRAAAKTLLFSPLKTIKTLDPNLYSFININTQEDLERLQTRSLQGPIQQDVVLDRERFFVSDLQLLREADKICQEDNFGGAQEKFDLCKKRFEEGNNFFWAALANEGKAGALLKQVQILKRKEPTSISQTLLELDFKYKEAFCSAANNYHQEAMLYMKKHCIRLLDRAMADKQYTLTAMALSTEV